MVGVDVEPTPSTILTNTFTTMPGEGQGEGTSALYNLQKKENHKKYQNAKRLGSNPRLGIITSYRVRFNRRAVTYPLIYMKQLK